jgi:hypothetical protein
MELAVIISLVALAIALPGCIADTLSIIQALKKEGSARPALVSLKKVIRSGLDHAERLPLLKKI